MKPWQLVSGLAGNDHFPKKLGTGSERSDYIHDGGLSGSYSKQAEQKFCLKRRGFDCNLADADIICVCADGLIANLG